jgi:secreted trypsin-like serine protease
LGICLAFCAIFQLWTVALYAENDCGVSSSGIPKPVERVLSGRNISEGDYPWLVALLYNSEFICGGSIISKNYILTE